MSHGLFLPVREDTSEDEEFVRELAAWRAVLPSSAAFTHVTAARLLGWRLPKLPEQVPVFVAVGLDDRRPRRDGLICSRLTRPRRQATRHGHPVEAPEEIVLRAARDLGVLDLVVLLDSALRSGDLEVPRLLAVLGSRRPGVGVLRAAYELSDRRRESAGESVLGVFQSAVEVAAEPQVTLLDDEGRVLGRADYLVTGTTWVHEYDGEVHRDPKQHRSDLRRERMWAGTAYRRRGFTLDDLLNHAGVVVHEMDRSLGRPHHPRRLERWRILVRESMYDPVGRARVLNRWSRAMGVVQWS